MIDFFIPGSARPKGRPRTAFKGGRAITYTPQRTRDWAELGRVIAISEYNKKKLAPIPYPEPVKVTLEFYLKRKATATPDIVNLAVQLLDVLESVSYDNDSQVVELHVYQWKGNKPRTRVIVEELTKPSSVP